MADTPDPIGERSSACGCSVCLDARRTDPLEPRYMVLCPTCGNKRCPRASYHGHDCTGSNEPGQRGSDYGEPCEHLIDPTTPDPDGRGFADPSGLRQEPTMLDRAEFIDQPTVTTPDPVRERSSAQIQGSAAPVDLGAGTTSGYRPEDYIKAIRFDHFRTIAPAWGEETNVPVCGRCRYGDGVSYRYPCPTLINLDRLAAILRIEVEQP